MSGRMGRVVRSGKGLCPTHDGKTVVDGAPGWLRVIVVVAVMVVVLARRRRWRHVVVVVMTVITTAEAERKDSRCSSRRQDLTKIH
jgi:hypothetical protein